MINQKVERFPSFRGVAIFLFFFFEKQRAFWLIESIHSKRKREFCCDIVFIPIGSYAIFFRVARRDIASYSSDSWKSSLTFHSCSYASLYSLFVLESRLGVNRISTERERVIIKYSLIFSFFFHGILQYSSLMTSLTFV